MTRNTDPPLSVLSQQRAKTLVYCPSNKEVNKGISYSTNIKADTGQELPKQPDFAATPSIFVPLYTLEKDANRPASTLTAGTYHLFSESNALALVLFMYGYENQPFICLLQTNWTWFMILLFLFIFLHKFALCRYWVSSYFMWEFFFRLCSFLSGRVGIESLIFDCKILRSINII